MEQLIIGLFSPILLMAFILMAFAMILGINPESVLKPYFNLVSILIRSLVGIFILGIKLVLQGSSQKYIYSEPFKFPRREHINNNSGNQDIRIVPSEE